MNTQTNLTIKRSRVGLLERGKGVFGSVKGTPVAVNAVSMPVDYVPPVPEDGRYPFFDIYAYPGRKSALERAFADTRIPPDGAAVSDVSGHLMRKRYYKVRRRTGFLLSLIPFALAVIAVILCFV